MNHFFKSLDIQVFRGVFYFISLVFFGNSYSFTQNYSFLSYSNSQGLPQSQVQCIEQDQNGYLWVGTLGGLAKFNGKKFTNYSTENGLLNNRITTLTAIENELWVGHQGGVSVLKNGKAKGYSFFGDDRTSNVTAIVQFQHKIVASVDGGGLYIIWGKTMRKINFPNENAYKCRDILVVGDKLYIGTDDGVYSTTNLKTVNWEKEFGHRSISSFAQRGNKIVISTFVDGLFYSTQFPQQFDSIPLVRPDFFILNAFTDRSKQLWINSPDGVIRIAPNGSQLELNEQNGLPVGNINCVFEDREGIIWMGSEGKGLLRFTGEKFTHFNTKSGFPSDLFLSVAQSNKNSLLLGSYDKGLFNLEANGKTSNIPISGTSIWSILKEQNGSIWVGTDVGLTHIEPSGNQVNYSLTDEVSRISIIKKMNNGMILVGGGNGIGLIRDHTFIRLNLSNTFEKTIGSVRDFNVFNDKIICATQKGLFEIIPSKGRFKKIKSFSAGITSLALDDNNRMWIGTENGLYLYDGISFTPLKIGNSNGARFVNFQEKIDNHMYVGTNNGLYKFDCNEEKPSIIEHFDINDGLVNLESNINSAFYDGDFLWFGTAEGLARFDVDEIEDLSSNVHAPLLNITSLLLNYQPFDLNEFAGGIDARGFPTSLVLPYRKNNLILDLDAILLSNPDGISYQFWLEGEDEKWSPAIKNASIVLSNISSGDYILHVRALDEMGVVSEQIRLPIEITPPFWRTWWFYFLGLVVVFFTIRTYFRVQLRRERDRNYQENLEDKSRLLTLEQQSLNASMNRHFIFNSLNSIQYFINTQDRLSANRYLTSFAKLIRKNLDSAAEDNNMVVLSQELERLELYMSLEAMRFKDRFTYSIVSDEEIDTEQVIVPSMLLQPFVENSIIHGILPDESKIGVIAIKLSIIGHQLEISIDDNGIGIDFSLDKKRQFQGDHKSQGMEITAKRIDLIRKMWKKDYELIGPFQMSDLNHSISGTRVLIKIPLENLDFID